jgi:hypothetical protein
MQVSCIFLKKRKQRVGLEITSRIKEVLQASRDDFAVVLFT